MSSHRLSPSGRAHLHELAEERERDWHGRFVSDGMEHSHPRYLTSSGKARLRELVEEKLEGHMHHSPYLTSAGKARLRELAEERLGSVVHHHHYYGDHHRGWNAEYEPRDWHGRFMSSSNRSSASKKLKKPGRSPRSLAASSRPRNELGQFMSY